MSKPTLYIDSRLHIPVTHVDAASVTKRLTKYEFEDMVCKNCEFRPERPSSECRTCSAGGLLAITCLASPSIMDDEKHISIPYGELHRFEKTTDMRLKDFKIKDLTNKSKYREPVEFTGELRGYQIPAVDDLIEERSGLLMSAPRTGKCLEGDSVVDTSFGQVSMERLWSEFGNDTQESVPTYAPLLIQTPEGTEPVSWLHRKKSITLKVETHFGARLAGTPEHPVQVVTPDLDIVWRRMDELSAGDWIVSKPKASTVRPPASLVQVENVDDIVQPTAVTKELAYLTGHWTIGKSISKSTDIPSGRPAAEVRGSAYAEFMRKTFGLNLNVKRGVAVLWLSYYSDTLYDFLQANGFSFSPSSNTVVPEYILKSGPEIHKAYLTGLFQSSSDTRNIGYRLLADNAKLMNQISTMLLSLGIIPAQDPETLEIRLDKGQYINLRNVGVDHEEGFLDRDVIPYIGEDDSNYTQKGVHRSYLDETQANCTDPKAVRFMEKARGLIFHRVSTITPQPESWVYDLTVEGSHSFLANGFAVHNTVMFIAAAIKAGYRACIIADQKDFLDGFMETIEALTNLSELEEDAGRKLFGFPKTIKDYDNYEIALVTYQSLSQDSKTSRERLEAVNRNYGTILVDEAHRANALVFSRLLNSIRAKHRWACTATPKRKDGKDYVLRSILGPIVASTDAKSLNATLCVHRTSKRVTSRNKYTGKAGWVKFCQFLAKHPDRNAKILKWLIRDIDRGRSIALPVMFTDHAKLIVDAINEHYGEEVAICFLGGAQQAKLRKGIVDRARAGEIKLIVGTRRLIQVGINIPQWDTLYYVMPMNNEPNWYQESCRILTPLDNKKTPIIRLFLDTKMERAVQCFRQVLKFSDKLGYKKAPKTPRKLRNWIGIVAKEDVFSAEMPDYFEQGPTRGVKVNPPKGRQL